MSAIVLKCPACREKFKYDVSEGWPDDCPLCKTDINNRRDDDEIVMPNILSFKTKNTDGVARQVMDGSETRAELAAAMAGVPVSEMSALKITDIKTILTAPEERGYIALLKRLNAEVFQPSLTASTLPFEGRKVHVHVDWTGDTIPSTP